MTLAWLLACATPPPPDAPGPPIVVWMTVDTLGAAAAREIGFCERIAAIAIAHGTTARCPDGAVAPSTWTAPSHARTWFPSRYADPAARPADAPSCDDTGLLDVAKPEVDRVVVGLDNMMFAPERLPDCGGTTPYTRAADVAHVETSIDGWYPVPAPERPAHASIEALVGSIHGGEAVIALLNTIDGGSHTPRCWWEPERPSCRAMWDEAVARGLVAADADPALEWRHEALIGQLLRGWVDAPEREDEVRPLAWDTAVAGAAYGFPVVEQRLERILGAAALAGRVDDVVIVVTGDHGENPCTTPLLGPMSCGHDGIATPWTSLVPAAVIPAARADGWIAGGLVGDGEPWSTVNLAFALAADLGATIPPAWGAPEPVGAASSWSCTVADDRMTGRIVGDRAVICMNEVCATESFGLPASPDDEPVAVDDERLVALYTALPADCVVP